MKKAGVDDPGFSLNPRVTSQRGSASCTLNLRKSTRVVKSHLAPFHRVKWIERLPDVDPTHFKSLAQLRGAY
jgi:hypothetical protein